MIIFYIIVSLYCITNMVLNLIVLPVKNLEFKRQNEYILARYERFDKLMDKAEKIIRQRKYYGKL